MKNLKVVFLAFFGLFLLVNQSYGQRSSRFIKPQVSSKGGVAVIPVVKAVNTVKFGKKVKYVPNTRLRIGKNKVTVYGRSFEIIKSKSRRQVTSVKKMSGKRAVGNNLVAASNLKATGIRDGCIDAGNPSDCNDIFGKGGSCDGRPSWCINIKRGIDVCFCL